MTSQEMVTIIDLGIGNLQSVASAFARAGAASSIVETPEASRGAKIVVLPGVGAFEPAMKRLLERGFGPYLRGHVLERGQPLIGICLGMQLLADRSHEHGVCAGLGLISAEVVRLKSRPPEHRVPNIGWMPVKAAKASAMFPAEVNGQSFYHVHSYHLRCNDPSDIAATIEFGGEPIVTAVERGNVYGVQFHPEKSQDAGLNLLQSLLNHLGQQPGHRTP